MIFNNINLESEFNFHLKDSLIIPKPRKNVRKVNVVGRDSTLIRDYKTYQNYRVSVSGHMLKDKRQQFNNLFSKKGKLTYPSDESFFIYANLFDEITYKEIIKDLIAVDFTLECEPYIYAFSGLSEIALKAENALSSSYINSFLTSSLPTIKIKANGNITLKSTNASKVYTLKLSNLNASREVIIDSHRKIIYRDDFLNLSNEAVGEFPIFSSGTNSLSITTTDVNSLSIKVIPNWRAL